jgi:hypothetical protein
MTTEQQLTLAPASICIIILIISAPPPVAAGPPVDTEPLIDVDVGTGRATASGADGAADGGTVLLDVVPNTESKMLSKSKSSTDVDVDVDVEAVAADDEEPPHGLVAATDAVDVDHGLVVVAAATGAARGTDVVVEGSEADGDGADADHGLLTGATLDVETCTGVATAVW